MKIHKSFYLLTALLLTVLSLPIISHAASTIGVVQTHSKLFKAFNPVDGSLLSSQTLLYALQQDEYRYYDYLVANIRSDIGAEWVTYNYPEGTSGSQVSIYSQEGSLVDGFSTGMSTSQIITVGELSSENGGEEIVACKTSSSVSRLKIFSYTEGVGASQLLSFKPFGEGSRYDRGCSKLAIGDTNGDGENEIVTFRYHSKYGNNSLVKIFNANGNPVSSFLPPHTDDINDRIYVEDIDGDGSAEIIFQSNNQYIFAYDENGQQVYRFDSQAFNNKDIVKFDVADIDDDGVADVVIQEKGIKIKILILNAVGQVSTSYNLYPEAVHTPERTMFLGDFSTDL